MINRPTVILRRAVLAAALALPCTLGAQVRLELTPFAAYMPGWDMESEWTVSRNGQSAEGSLTRNVDGGPAFGVRADAGFSRFVGVYAQAAVGETGQRDDNFWSMSSVMPPVAVTADGYRVRLLSAGVSLQPAGRLFRVYGGPALVRLSEIDGRQEARTHGAIHAGFAIAFDVMPRVQLTAGADEFVVLWDDAAVADDFTAEVAPAVTAEGDSDKSFLPVIRLGLTLRP